jgi:uncharacterized membrane protein
MLNDSFEMGDIFRRAWKIFGKNFWAFMGLAAVFVFANLLLIFFDIPYIPYIDFIVKILVNTYLLLSFSKAALIAARGGKINLAALKNTKNEFFRFIIVTLIYSIGPLIATFSTILVFFTVLIIALFLPLPFIIITKDLPLIESIKQTIDLSTPNFASLALYCLLSLLLCVVSCAALGIGVLIGISVIIIGSAVIYLDISQTSR